MGAVQRQILYFAVQTNNQFLIKLFKDNLKSMLRIFWKMKKTPKLWWFMTGFWTLLVYAVVICDYVKDNAWQGYLNPLLVIYIGILAIYAGDKFGVIKKQNQ